MIRVELISKKDCPLCDKAKEVLLRVQKTVPFDLKETKITEGDELSRLYGERIPVILIDNEFAFQYRVSDEMLVHKLKQMPR